ncbi:hypothetical protein, partial [Actinocorallia lasiicapitis]
MSVDRAAYERDVLGPAVAGGGTPPADLFARYGLTGSERMAPAAFTAHVEEMVKLWRSTGVKSRRFRALTDAMLAAHNDLAERKELTWQHFERGRKENEGKAQARLKERIEQLAAAGPCVSAAAVRLLAGGVIDEATVRAMLASHQVTVVDPLWRLPDQPSGGRGLRTAVRTLGLDLSADQVFGRERRQRGFRLSGGFRLNSGERLTADVIGRKKTELAGKTFDSRKSASDTVFAVLEKAAREGSLEDLLLWEVAEALREAVEAQLPLRMIIGEAASLGLAEADAQGLALSLVEQRSGPNQGGGAAAEAAE